MEKALSLVIYVFTSFSLNGQNLIINGDFENYSSLPTNMAQADRLNNWYSDYERFDNGGSIFYAHSPDAFHTDAYSPLGSAKFNKGYIGMTVYEIIYQSINLVEGKKYALSYHFKLSDVTNQFDQVSWNNCSFRVILAKNNITYKNYANDPDCIDPVSYSELNNGITQSIVQIASFPYDLNYYPASSGWHHQAIVFESPPDNDPNLLGYYDWIGFEIVSNNMSVCGDAYILLDNIELYEFCDTYCSSQLTNPPTNITAFPNAFCGNWSYGSACPPWGVILDNVNNLEFHVYANWGLAYNFKSFDVKELVNDPFNGQIYSDYLLEYHGATNWGGNLIEGKTYVFALKAENCNNAPFVWAHWVNCIDIDGQAFVIPEIHHIDITHCCDDNTVYNDITFPNYFRKDVDDYINLGLNGPGLTVVTQGNYATFNAGNQINLGQFFDYTPGVEVEFNIVPCGRLREAGVPHDTAMYLPLIMPDSLVPPPDFSTFDYDIDSALTAFFGFPYSLQNSGGSKGSIISNTALNSDLIVSLTNSVLSLNSQFKGILEYSIFDLNGKKILSVHNINSQVIQKDLSQIAQGLYFIKVVFDDRTVEFNKVVIF